MFNFRKKLLTFAPSARGLNTFVFTTVVKLVHLKFALIE